LLQKMRKKRVVYKENWSREKKTKLPLKVKPILLTKGAFLDEGEKRGVNSLKEKNLRIGSAIKGKVNGSVVAKTAAAAGGLLSQD